MSTVDYLYKKGREGESYYWMICQRPVCIQSGAFISRERRAERGVAEGFEYLRKASLQSSFLD